jgi:hypothetical protein
MPLPGGLAAELCALIPAGDPDQVATYRLLGRNGNSMSGFSKIKVILDTRSNVQAWRLQDLRRTCRSGLSALGVPMDVAERCLNHVPQGLVATYDMYGYRNEILKALQRWQTRLAVIVGEVLPDAADPVTLLSPSVV